MGGGYPREDRQNFRVPQPTYSRAEQRIHRRTAPITYTAALLGADLFEESRSSMFLILAVVLVLLWLGGFFVLHVSSFLIHLLLIFALISIIMNFVGGRRAV